MYSKKEPKLMKEYLIFLQDDQCVSQATITIRKNYVKPFLISIGNVGQPSKLDRLAAAIIHDYIISTAAPLHRASKKHLTSSIRSFLRFAYIKSYLKRDLINAVPVIATRKLDRLPQYLPWKDIKQLLKMPDQRTHSGRRDYAILVILAAYGVRISQVLGLKLNSIQWRTNSIVFKECKNGNPLRLPLQDEVAKAILSYLKRDRMGLPFDEVFLTVRGRQRPLSKNNHFTSVLRKYYKKAKINSHSQGSRVIRHSFAAKLVAQETPIKTISDLLGHRSPSTTHHYIEIDMNMKKKALDSFNLSGRPEILKGLLKKNKDVLEWLESI